MHTWHYCTVFGIRTTYEVCIKNIITGECKGCTEIKRILKEKIETEQDKELKDSLTLLLKKLNNGKRIRGYKNAIKFLIEYYGVKDGK